MREINKVCSITELVDLVVKQINLNDPGTTNFRTVDFAVLDTDTVPEDADLEQVVMDASGWYGIRRIETGFDDPDLTLCANYYSGGIYPSFCHLFSGREEKDVRAEILRLITVSIERGESLTISPRHKLAVQIRSHCDSCISVKANGGRIFAMASPAEDPIGAGIDLIYETPDGDLAEVVSVQVDRNGKKLKVFLYEDERSEGATRNFDLQIQEIDASFGG